MMYSKLSCVLRQVESVLVGKINTNVQKQKTNKECKNRVIKLVNYYSGFYET